MRYLFLLALILPLRAHQIPRLDPARIAKIATWLTPKPSTHFAPSFADRTFWDAWKSRPDC